MGAICNVFSCFSVLGLAPVCLSLSLFFASGRIIGEKASAVGRVRGGVLDALAHVRLSREPKHDDQWRKERTGTPAGQGAALRWTGDTWTPHPPPPSLM